MPRDPRRTGFLQDVHGLPGSLVVSLDEDELSVVKKSGRIRINHLWREIVTTEFALKGLNNGVPVWLRK